MNRRLKYILSPTSEISEVHRLFSTYAVGAKIERERNYFLYVLSGDAPKKDEWYCVDGYSIKRCSSKSEETMVSRYGSRIIASNDPGIFTNTKYSKELKENYYQPTGVVSLNCFDLAYIIGERNLTKESVVSVEYENEVDYCKTSSGRLIPKLDKGRLKLVKSF